MNGDSGRVGHDEVGQLDRNQRLLLLMATVVTAASRLLALARSPWDWDEILFCLGVRHFDLSRHHPHPPGFPLFIAAGKLLAALGLSDFHALQMVSLLAAMLLLPAAFDLARQLRIPFAAALASALLLAFLPNVWFYGGMALSDVPSLTAMLFAAALLLRGREITRAFFCGVFVLALAAMLRPQNLLIGFVPAVLATCSQWTRSRARVLFAALGAALALVAAYGIVAQSAGGWSPYLAILRAHQRYITQTDSVFAASHPAIVRTLDDFFFWPFRDLPVNIVLSVLIAVSLAGIARHRDRGLLILLGSFGPFALFALLFLDINSVSRFSIGYAPLFAFLAADGATRAGRYVSAGSDRRAGTAGAAIVTFLLILMMSWTMPSLRLVRHEDSPPMFAVKWLMSHAGADDVIEVHQRLDPWAEYFLTSHRIEPTGRFGPPARWTSERSWFLSEIPFNAPEAARFVRRRDTLGGLVRHRYFESMVYALPRSVRFVSGWYEEEPKPLPHRWMGAVSSTQLPPITGDATLHFVLGAPGSVPPSVEVRLDGVLVDRFRCGAVTDKTYRVRSARSAPVLTIAVDRTFNLRAAGLSNDSRELGLRLDELGWFSAAPID